MEYGPLPPHERTWRHPSELAAEEHAAARAETTGVTTRVFAFTTGTLGLLAVGLLVVAVTPGRSDSPIAISATTSPVAVESTAIALAGTAPGATDRAPVGLRAMPETLATPIEEGRFAVVTWVDLDRAGVVPSVGAAIEVAVPSGRTHDARVVGRAGDALLVELEGNEPGVRLADEQPDGDDVVTVMAEPPVTIHLDDLHALEVEEGTAVLDDDGELIGLCSESRDETRLLLVSDDVVEREPAESSGDGGAGDRGPGEDDGADDDETSDDAPPNPREAATGDSRPGDD